MNRISVRVQLHKGQNYAELHEAMDARGIERTITSKKGVVYDLPHGLYRYEGLLDTYQVLKLAQEAAADVPMDPPPKIVAIEEGDVWFSGLEVHQ